MLQIVQECKAYKKRCEDAELRLAELMQSNQVEMNRLQMEIRRLLEMLELACIDPDTGNTMV